MEHISIYFIILILINFNSKKEGTVNECQGCPTLRISCMILYLLDHRELKGSPKYLSVQLDNNLDLLFFLLRKLLTSVVRLCRCFISLK